MVKKNENKLTLIFLFRYLNFCFLFFDLNTIVISKIIQSDMIRAPITIMKNYDNNFKTFIGYLLLTRENEIELLYIYHLHIFYYNKNRLKFPQFKKR